MVSLAGVELLKMAWPRKMEVVHRIIPKEIKTGVGVDNIVIKRTFWSEVDQKLRQTMAEKNSKTWGIQFQNQIL